MSKRDTAFSKAARARIYALKRGHVVAISLPEEYPARRSYYQRVQSLAYRLLGAGNYKMHLVPERSVVRVQRL